jgi:hypothetical protein
LPFSKTLQQILIHGDFMYFPCYTLMQSLAWKIINRMSLFSQNADLRTSSDIFCLSYPEYAWSQYLFWQFLQFFLVEELNISRKTTIFLFSVPFIKSPSLRFVTKYLLFSRNLETSFHSSSVKTDSVKKIVFFFVFVGALEKLVDFVFAEMRCYHFSQHALFLAWNEHCWNLSKSIVIFLLSMMNLQLSVKFVKHLLF